MVKTDSDLEASRRLAELDAVKAGILADCRAHLSTSRPLTDQDLFVLGAARRLLTQSRAFNHSVADKNGQVASALLRIQLDTVLRLYAIFWVADADAFVRSVRNGDQIDRMKDRHNQKMTDAHLRPKLTDCYPWIESVYKNTSGLIHLSNRHSWTGSK